MLTKSVLFAFVLGGFLQSALYADSAVCRAGDQLAVVPCSTLIGIENPYYSAGYGVAGNTINGSAAITLGAIGNATEVEQAVVNLNDTFSLPKSPSGDVYKLTALGTILSRNESEYQASTAGSMTVGQALFYQVQYGNCDYGYCIVRETIPADQARTISFQGSGSITVGPQVQYEQEGSSMSEFITLERFKSD